MRTTILSVSPKTLNALHNRAIATRVMDTI